MQIFHKIDAKQEYTTRCALFAAIIGLFIFPVIHANFYYQDDYARALHGWIMLAPTGRYLSHLIFLALNLRGHINDFSPLPQIAATLILALTLARLSLAWRFNRLSAILALPPICCYPYFLSNISFKFDSLTMALALGCAMAPFCFQAEDNTTKSKPFFLKTGFILALLNLYQPALTTFMALVFVDAIYTLYDRPAHKAFRHLAHGIAITIAAVLLYKLELTVLKVGNGYGSDHAMVTLAPHSILTNFFTLTKLTLREFGLYGGSLEIASGIGLLIGIGALLFKFCRRGSPLRLFSAFILLLGLFLSLDGLLPLLTHPVISPRVMMANGALFALAMSFLIGRQARFNGLKVIPVCIASWMLLIQLIIAFEWGNAMHQQYLLDEHISTALVEDIYQISNGQPVIVRLMARHPLIHDPAQKDRFLEMEHWAIAAPPAAPTAPMADAIWHKRQVIFNEVPMLVAWGWGKMLLAENNVQSNATLLSDENISPSDPLTMEEGEKIRTECHYDRIMNKRYYNIYKVKDKVVVDYLHICPARGE